MKMSFWQFLGLLAALAGLYYFYNYWWLDQDRNTWINKLNSGVYKSSDEMNKKESKPVKSSSWP
jgi:hypothetical protein